MIADLDLLDLELRQIPGVAAVAFENDSDAMLVQVLVSDPFEVERIRGQAERLASRRLEVPSIVELQIAGAPQVALRFEEEVASLPGVTSCTAERGPRGEVRRIALSVNSAEALEAARTRLAAAIGADVPEDRLNLEIVPT